jgi:hypothetical protein
MGAEATMMKVTKNEARSFDYGDLLVAREGHEGWLLKFVALDGQLCKKKVRDAEGKVIAEWKPTVPMFVCVVVARPDGEPHGEYLKLRASKLRKATPLEALAAQA